MEEILNQPPLPKALLFLGFPGAQKQKVTFLSLLSPPGPLRSLGQDRSLHVLPGGDKTDLQVIWATWSGSICVEEPKRVCVCVSVSECLCALQREAAGIGVGPRDMCKTRAHGGEGERPEELRAKGQGC